MKPIIPYLILFAWPVVAALMGLSFFHTAIPGFIILIAAIAVEASKRNLDGVWRTIGGWTVVYMVWSIIYALITGKGPGMNWPDDPR